MAEPKIGVRTWPISVRAGQAATLVGIARRLGDGRPFHAERLGPTLEEVSGPDWDQALLSTLLPVERAWAWWTRTDVVKQTGLSLSAAGEAIAPTQLVRAQWRHGFFGGMSLVFAPARSEAQQVIRKWADADTEQVADVIWTAPDGEQPWIVERLFAVCKSQAPNVNPEAFLPAAAERLLVMYDEFIHIAVSPPSTGELLDQVQQLATQWSLETVPGPDEYAWPGR